MSRHNVVQLDRFSMYDWYERCGVILNNPFSFIELPNTHSEPEHNFAMTHGDVRRVGERHHNLVLGFFHTHPGDRSMSRPSTRDLHVASQLREYIHAMYHPFTRKLVWYDHTGIVGVEHIRARLRYRGV